jgi:hypothetical protein
LQGDDHVQDEIVVPNIDAVEIATSLDSRVFISFLSELINQVSWQDHVPLEGSLGEQSLGNSSVDVI